MPRQIALWMLLAGAAGAMAQPAGKDKMAPRFGIEADSAKYSQKSPQDTLKSVLAAIENKQVDYLLAHLADPDFVDKRVEYYLKQAPGKEQLARAMAFQRLVNATHEHFQEDPTRIKELYRFAKDGEWKVAEKSAMVRHTQVPMRKAFFRKIQDRWFFEDRDR
jgi:hypothetical protein